MCYDCACPLKWFIETHFGSNDFKWTDFIQFCVSLSIGIDQYHMKSHKRAMCETIMRRNHPSHADTYTSILIQDLQSKFLLTSQKLNIQLEDIARCVSRTAEPPPPPLAENFESFFSRRRCRVKIFKGFPAAAAVMKI